jgi:hypothetical protein
MSKTPTIFLPGLPDNGNETEPLEMGQRDDLRCLVAADGRGQLLELFP